MLALGLQWVLGEVAPATTRVPILPPTVSPDASHAYAALPVNATPLEKYAAGETPDASHCATGKPEKEGLVLGKWISSEGH